MNLGFEFGGQCSNGHVGNSVSPCYTIKSEIQNDDQNISVFKSVFKQALENLVKTCFSSHRNLTPCPFFNKKKDPKDKGALANRR